MTSRSVTASRITRPLVRLGLCLALALSLAPAQPAQAADAETPAPLPASAPVPSPTPDAAGIYASVCAQCHGADRLGGMGPALIPETLGRLTPEDARATILAGRPATQMPGFSGALEPAMADALAGLILTPLEQTPTWPLERILASHRRLVDPADLPAEPIHGADALNLFVVVELGDHHATILDGDRLEPIHRFQTHPALHGGPKFTPDGRFVYFASRNGWISKFDLHSLQSVAEIRAGINTRNLALSGDGRYVAVANYLPHSLVILSAEDLTPLNVIPVVDDSGRGSRVSAVYAAPPRSSFVAALKDIPEIWEIKLADDPLPVYNGPMHDYRLGEGTARQTGRFPVQRTLLADYLDDFFFDPSYRLVLGAARDADQGQVVHLDARRKIADLDLAGMPHLGSGITWEYQGRQVLATPHLKESRVSVIDMTDWHTIARIETLGPGFFMRSHEASPYAWVDVFFGPHRDALHVIDKGTLEIVKTLRPSPGLTAAHVEFDRYGKYALVSVSEPAPNGALVIYDAATLEEVKRLPMNKPSGKYNVHNKISGSTGTSH
ncbi:nitrite reductase [Thiocapsa roseopersicina]|uniref:Cytochrome c, mono-and diheme variants n=1 Tax=Thiocapsa roseopersicina TaxID=1058 RepID=A0A1H2WMH4_THIRO|nr:nitrite reductase [Thiocapsa roseopersicina]SDW81698.1 Cytochrome c, mono-and diheme variants [Thiocapsa roseopersicina]